MKTIIGITPSHQNELREYYLKKNYVEAVLQAGGTPLILPITSDENIINNYLEIIDGLLLTGGIDPDPRYWGEESIPGMGKIDPLRDKFELSILKKACRKNMAVFGICRGFQLINVAFDGSLIQDIAQVENNYLKHMQQAPRWYGTHEIKISDNSLLKEIMEVNSLLVNSFHHQVCGKIGKGLKVSARANDGIIEALEAENKKFLLGVQWHPETMYRKRKEFSKIFQRFVDESKR